MKELIERRAALKAQLDALLNAAKTEERAMTEDEGKEFDRLEGEIRALDETIAREERARGIKNEVLPASGDDGNGAGNSDDKKDELEARAFLDYLQGKEVEMRGGEQNVTMSNNSAIIPTSISNKVIDAITEICPILAGADRYSVKGNLKIPKWTLANDTHDVTVGYASEFTGLTADSGKFTTVDLGGYLCGGLVLIGKSVINNTSIKVADFIVRKISEKSASFIEGELLKGTGSSAAQGALATTNTQTAAAASAISLADLVNLQSKIKQAYQKKACWTMHPTTWAAIKLLTDGQSRPLIEPDVKQEFPYRLLGKPVYLSDNMPTIASGAKTILYGDYSGLSVNFREDIGIEVLREAYHTMHAIGIDAWFEFDSRVTDEQKLAVLVQAGS